ncbi:MAG: VWA domain-containing protein [Flavobacteriales bacterium]|nr:VWA domain-containing protein [Flavobacteriales bacterium]
MSHRNYISTPIKRPYLPVIPGLRTAVLCFLLLTSMVSFAQGTKDEHIPTTRLLFVFDGSQSMFGSWQSGKKIDIAKKLLSEMLDSLDKVEHLQLALRVYGHQKPYPPQDCDDTKLEVPFGPRTAGKIKQRLQSITPSGTTPITLSLENAAKDFPPCSDCRNIIILITDGIEECGGDPCAVSLALQEKRIILKPFVIGIGLGINLKKTFECVGNYYDASDEKTFRNVLGIVISQALNNTTAQVNLLDQSGKPTETDVNMTFYDHFTGHIRYNFMHTINHRGNPDTLVIDPLPTYDVVVHTIPTVSIDSVALTPGKHTIIPLDAPQGTLEFKVSGVPQQLKAIVRKSGEMSTLNVQNFNTQEKYIIGTYDVEILTLPRIYENNVRISQSHTTTLEIPRPGLATVIMPSRGYGSLYLEKDNELVWIYNLNPNLTKETITLQPGNYRVVFRSINSKQSINTLEQSFRITSGSSIPVKL